jgi:hypothetical protein
MIHPVNKHLFLLSAVPDTAEDTAYVLEVDGVETDIVISRVDVGSKHWWEVVSTDKYHGARPLRVDATVLAIEVYNDRAL